MSRHQRIGTPGASSGNDIALAFEIVRARWKTVAAVTIAAMAACSVYVFVLASPRYEATALVVYQVPEIATNPTQGLLPSSGLTNENISTLIGITTSSDIVDRAAKSAKVTPQQLRASVRVAPAGDSSIIEFSAISSDAKLAAKLANAWAKALVDDRRAKVTAALNDRIARKEARRKGLAASKPKAGTADAESLAALDEEVAGLEDDRDSWSKALSVGNRAEVPFAASWPKPLLSLAAVLVIGLGAGIGVALLRDRIDDIVSVDELPLLPLPVTGRVPLAAGAAKGQPLRPDSIDPMVSDAFAALASRVMLGHEGDDALMIQVVSPRSGDGKSSVAANLAAALAQSGRRVVLVDADMRNSSQGRVFPVLQGRLGLSDVLTRRAELEQALTLVSPNLAAVGAGAQTQHASLLLASVAFRQLLGRLASISEVIVIDAPPLLAVNDALAIAPAVNHSLVVVRIGATSHEDIAVVEQRLAAGGGTTRSIVAVGVDRPETYGYDGANVVPVKRPAPASFPSGPGGGGGGAHPGAQHGAQPQSGPPPVAMPQNPASHVRMPQSPQGPPSGAAGVG